MIPLSFDRKADPRCRARTPVSYTHLDVYKRQVYTSDFYAGKPAVTVNHWGKGKCYYIAFRNNKEFLKDFYNALIQDLYQEGLHLERAIETDLPYGVTAQLRTDGQKDYVFVSNFDSAPKVVLLDDNVYIDLLTLSLIHI